MPQSHLFSLAGLIGLFNNTIGMRALVAGLGETNMMRFGILVYALEMVRVCPRFRAQPSPAGPCGCVQLLLSN